MSLKKNYYSSGFSIVSVLITSVLIGISIPVITNAILSLSKQTKLTSDTDTLNGLTNEIRNILSNETLCSNSIKKISFSYPGIDTNTGVIPQFILDSPVNPAVKDNVLVNLTAPSFPIEFNLPDGRTLSGSNSQSGLPLEINSLKLYGAEMVAEDSLTRLYTGSVFMSAKIDKQNSMQPTYIQSINLSVDKSTNTILGCSTESSVESLCLSMGGLYNPANNPSCSFTGGCTSGSIAISETDGSTRCRSLRELIGKVCPPDNYVLTNAAGTNIECKTGKRNISFPTATCWSPGNTSCTVNVNFMSALSAFDKANRNIEYIKVSMLSSIGGGGVCASGALSGSMYDNSTPYRIYGNWGKKRFEISVDANLTTGDVLLRSTAVNWGKTSSGGASVCKVSIEIQLDGP